MAHFIEVRLLSEMKMRCQRVLKKMHKEISHQHKHQCLLTRQMNGFRNYIDKRHGQHVAGPKRQKILQIFPRPIAPYNKIPANQIPRRRDKPQPRRQRRPKCQVVSHRSATALLPRLQSTLRPLCKVSLFGLYLFTSLLHFFIRYAETKSHPLLAQCILSPPTSPAPSPALPQCSPPPANRPTSRLRPE